MQCQIINRSNPTETQTREAATTPVHQRPAGLAEGAGHGVACADCGIGRVGGEVVETADVIQRGGFDRDLWDGVIFLFLSMAWVDTWLAGSCVFGFCSLPLNGDESITYVRSKHSSRDLAAVVAVADVDVDEIVAFDGLCFVERSIVCSFPAYRVSSSSSRSQVDSPSQVEQPHNSK